jgi:hypothetical protein
MSSMARSPFTSLRGNSMKPAIVRYVLYVVPVLIVAILVTLIEREPDILGPMSREDGPIEYLTAFSFAIAAIAFAIAAVRTPVLRQPPWGRLMTIGWALLMFLAAGEEISWGQRIFGIETPEFMSKINAQDETTLHNISAVNEFMGGTYRWMTIYLLLTGLGIPLVATTKWGRSLFGFFRFPVSPWSYSILFLGAYAFGLYYRVWFPVPGIEPANTPTEVRELLMGLGSAFFAVHAALWPQDTYVGTSGR